MTIPRLNWKANLTCYKKWRKEAFSMRMSLTGSSVVAQWQQTPVVNVHQTSCADPTLFPATNPILSKTITAEAPVTAEVWQTLMEQLNKANQDNESLKKGILKESSTKPGIGCQSYSKNQALVAKVKTSTKDTGTKATKVWKIQFRKKSRQQ